MGKRLITVEDIVKAAEAGNTTILAPPGESIVTPMARDRAEVLGIVIDEGSAAGPGARPAPGGMQPSQTDQVVRQVCKLMQDKLPAGVDASTLERLIREKVAARLGGTTPGPKPSATDETCAEGVCFIDGQRLMDGGAGPIPVDEKVLVADAIPSDGENRLAGGYMEWENASFNRTVDFPEIGIVIEGELHLTVGGKTLIGKPGDMVYFPKGAMVIYGTPSKVKLACVNCIL